MNSPANIELLKRKFEVLKILTARDRIQQSFIDFCRNCGFEPAEHHRLLIKQLERLARSEINRLAVFMPPGSAKSTYASILFPAWFLASHKDAALIAASHTTELAEKWGRRVRNLVVEHGLTLDLALSEDSAAAGRWALASGGEYYAAGVGVGIAGFRADLAIIDDPIRSREDADSRLIRDRIWDWYKSDLSTRMKPGGRMCLIQTRWNESDLAGRILDEMAKGGDQWEILSLPAQAEEDDALGRHIGEFLWDDDYGYGEFLRHEKKTQTPRNWSALFQQRPAPEEGIFFQSDWLRPYETAPPQSTLAIYGASDYAVTADGGDYTVHLVVGVDPEDRIYLLDLWRGQTTTDRWIEQWCRLVKYWHPMDWAEESGQISTSLGPFIEQQARKNKAYVNREQFPTRHEKAVRAQSIRGRMAVDGLYVPVHADWYADFRAELLTFPDGRHDDQVDALGLIGQLLDRMVVGRLPDPPRAPTKPKDYVAFELDRIEDQWKAF